MSKIGINWPAWPQYGREEAAAVARVVASNQLFAAGEVRAFEEKFARFTKSDHAIGLGNATQGLHLALAALGIGQGDEVIVTPYSWISSASCILMQNAVPVFCDVESETFGIDPGKLESCITTRTRAVILVHMFGYPSRVGEIKSILDRRAIPLIEDASHVHGATSDGRMLGSFGALGVFSLHQRKALSVGDGGVVISSDERLSEKIKRLRSFGDEDLSYNYRMTEFAAALASVGLEKLTTQNQVRINNARRLEALLAGFDEVSVVQPRPGDVAVYYAVLLRLNKKLSDLDERLVRLQSKGIPIRKTWNLLHRHPHFNQLITPPRGAPWLDPSYSGQMYGVRYRDLSLPVAETYLPERVLELYVHPPAGDAEIDFAAAHIRAEFCRS